MHDAIGVASRAEGVKAVRAPSIERALGHDTARGIPGAQEEDVVLAIRHDEDHPKRSRMRYCGLEAAQHELIEDGAGARHDSPAVGLDGAESGATSLPYTVFSPKV